MRTITFFLALWATVMLAAAPAGAISTAIAQIAGADLAAVNPGDSFDVEITLSLDGGGFLYSWSSALVLSDPDATVTPIPGEINGGLAGALHYGFNAGPDPTFCGGSANSCFGGVGQLGGGVVDEGGGVYRLGVYGGVISVAGFVDQSPQAIARLRIVVANAGAHSVSMSFAGQSALQDNGSNDPAQGLLLDDDSQVSWGSLGYSIVPEPSTAVLVGLGLLGVSFTRRA